jgi:hypothetical protein
MITEGRVIKCVLTGGPCGGKSSVLALMQKVFPDKGFKVVSVPEAATILVINGGEYPGLVEEKRGLLLEFESLLVRLQLQLEETFVALADYYKKQGENVVVVYDRGLMDVKAYAPEDIWQGLMSEFHFTEEELMRRYDMVVHLVTAADGAEAFYTGANNAARHETAEQARALDTRTFGCWKGHPQLFRVENKPVERSFDVKIADTLAALESYISSTD